MNMLKKCAAVLTACGLLLNGTSVRLPVQTAAAAETVTFSGLEGLPFANGDPFKGVDVSSVISLENSGVKFYDRSGRERDLFVTLKSAGVNTVRVRVWNDPYNSSTRENYGGGICDQNVAVQIAKRCADAGLKLLVDFHYSDFWADPGKQRAPKAWANYSVSQKADAIYDFTLDTLKKIGATGADIAMATSELMKTYQAAIWAQHGLFASGPDFDITFGLAHTIEKSAEVYVKVLSTGQPILQTITDDALRAIAKDFGVQLNEAFLD